jgi:hypothetical protein
MVMDLQGREYYFHFAPNQLMKFEGLIENVEEEGLGASSYFQQLAKDASKIVTFSSAFPEPNRFFFFTRARQLMSRKHRSLKAYCAQPNRLEGVFKEYSELFSGHLGTVKGAKYAIDLVDQVLVQSPPYHCAPRNSNY